MEGPKPKWARTDGGEGGSHPSNVHDHVYAIGSINFTGDMPIALMPDGPSLGGFVCPATIIASEMWKMGQVRPEAVAGHAIFALALRPCGSAWRCCSITRPALLLLCLLVVSTCHVANLQACVVSANLPPSLSGRNDLDFRGT